MRQKLNTTQDTEVSRRAAIAGTTALAASTLLLSKEAKAAPPDPAIEAYVNWVNADTAFYEASSKLSNLELPFPDGTISTVYREISPNARDTLIIFSNHEQIEEAFKLSKIGTDEKATLHNELDQKIAAREKAELVAKPQLDEARRKETQASITYDECKKGILETKPTSMLGAALKMNAIASYNVDRVADFLVLQNEMLELARQNGQFLEDIPVDLFDLREIDASYCGKIL